MHRRSSVGQPSAPVTFEALADDRDQTRVHDALLFHGLELLEPRLLLSAMPTTDHCATLFLSDKGLGLGASLGVPQLALRPGEQMTLYLWAKVPEDLIIHGLTFDVLASSYGVVQTDGSSITNPVVNGSTRWETNINPGHPSDLWRGQRLFAVQTAGINGELQALDPTYDAQADAYLVGSLTFTAMAAGRTDLFLESNAGGGLAYRMTDEPWATTAQPWVQLGDDAAVIAHGQGVRSEHAEATITVLTGPPVAPLPEVKDYRPMIDAVLPDGSVLREGEAPIELMITRDRDLENTLTIDLLISGSASPNEMRVLRGSGGVAKIQVVDGRHVLRVTFEAGSSSVKFSLSTPRDSKIEHTEQFNLNLPPGDGFQVGENLRALSLDVQDFDQYATIFLSDKGPGEGAELTTQHLTFVQGQHSTLYLWVKVPQGVTLQSLWVVVSERYSADLLTADGASAENPTVDGQTRWQWCESPLQGARLQNWVFQMSGADGVGGVDGDARSQDPTYDAEADAYLLGAITFTAMTPGDTRMMISVNFPSLVDEVYEGQTGPALVGVGEDPNLISLNKGDGHLSDVPQAWMTILPAPVIEPPAAETPIPVQPEASALVAPTVDHHASLFLSDRGLGEGASLGVPELSLRPGEQVTFYLWARVPEDMIINGLTFDVLAADRGVVQSGSSKISNPVINGSSRWESNINKGYPSDLWKDQRLFAVQTTGINGAFKELDPTYDAQADAYLVGSFTFTAMAAGQTALYLESNAGGGMSYRTGLEDWTGTEQPWVQLGDDAPVVAYGQGVRSERAEAYITILSAPVIETPAPTQPEPTLPDPVIPPAQPDPELEPVVVLPPMVDEPELITPPDNDESQTPAPIEPITMPGMAEPVVEAPVEAEPPVIPPVAEEPVAETPVVDEPVAPLVAYPEDPTPPAAEDLIATEPIVDEPVVPPADEQPVDTPIVQPGPITIQPVEPIRVLPVIIRMPELPSDGWIRVPELELISIGLYDWLILERPMLLEFSSDAADVRGTTAHTHSSSASANVPTNSVGGMAPVDLSALAVELASLLAERSSAEASGTFGGAELSMPALGTLSVSVAGIGAPMTGDLDAADAAAAMRRGQAMANVWQLVAQPQDVSAPADALSAWLDEAQDQLV